MKHITVLVFFCIFLFVACSTSVVNEPIAGNHQEDLQEKLEQNDTIIKVTQGSTGELAVRATPDVPHGSIQISTDAQKLSSDESIFDIEDFAEEDFPNENDFPVNNTLYQNATSSNNNTSSAQSGQSNQSASSNATMYNNTQANNTIFVPVPMDCRTETNTVVVPANSTSNGSIIVQNRTVCAVKVVNYTAGSAVSNHTNQSA